MGMVPETCHDSWQYGNSIEQMGCAMVPMMLTSSMIMDHFAGHPNHTVPADFNTLAIPAMEQLMPACAEIDISGGVSSFANMLTMPSAPSLGWQVYVTPAASRFVFNAPESKFKSKDKTIVFEQFELRLGCESLPFRVKVIAKKVHDRKCGQCFHTARGCGQLELKCEGTPPKNSEPIIFQFIVGNGCNAETRGPATHDFLLTSIAKLPADQEEWDFNAFVDPATKTVPICIEVATTAPSH